jgi:nucleoside-diphosphate-sugar epimerase
METNNISKNLINIILTGATGFLGSHLLGKMLVDGYHVTALKRNSSDTWRIKKWLDHPNLTLFDIDKESDPRVMFEVNRIDIIVHAATEYGRKDTNISKILDVNLILPVRLIEIGIEYGVKCFINTDSFFNKENNGHSNLLNYSLSKKSLMLWLRHLSKNIRVINIMLEHVYGPADNESKFVEHLIQQIAVIKAPRVALSPGNQKRDFIYVQDVVEAYTCLIQHGLNNEFSFKEFEVGTGTSIRVRDFVEVVKSISGSTTELGFGDLPCQSNETVDSKADNSALKELGWKPKKKLEEGVSYILKTYGTLKANS